MTILGGFMAERVLVRTISHTSVTGRRLASLVAGRTSQSLCSDRDITQSLALPFIHHHVVIMDFTPLRWTRRGFANVLCIRQPTILHRQRISSRAVD